ncbi:MAG: hypothetical protein RJQ04_12050 [Longimicrobiales bacterium]
MPRIPTLFVASGLALITFLAACGGDPSAATGVIDREIFVATYVDLRVTALHGSGELSEAQRTAVLERHSVTEGQLTAFVDAHAQDLDFMRDVWNDVEARLDATRSRPDPDSVAGD